MEAALLKSDQISEDTVLGGRVTIRQPREGYRAAIDPILLAAAVPAKSHHKILDAGTGVGTAALCLAARVSGISMTAIENNPTLVALARENIKLNKFDINVLEGNIATLFHEPHPAIEPGTFDHVMANPPYLPEAHGRPSPNNLKHGATHETQDGFESWVAFAHAALKHKGMFTLIHRADRLDVILRALSGPFGDICVLPLWPKRMGGESKLQEAKRVIVRARKGVASPLRMLSGVILHEADGAYTPEAEGVLRSGHGINF